MSVTSIVIFFQSIFPMFQDMFLRIKLSKRRRTTLGFIATSTSRKKNDDILRGAKKINLDYKHENDFWRTDWESDVVSKKVEESAKNILKLAAKYGFVTSDPEKAKQFLLDTKK